MSELSVCRQCRREGIKLFLKGDRCFTDKCGVERRTYAPGQHGQASKKLSDYGLQLREKQKVKRIYGIKEKQFRKIFAEAERLKGITGDNLLLLLEKRLDNVIYRIGFARSRAEARKLVKQGHVLVNEERVNIPSYLLERGDKITIKEKSHKVPAIVESVEGAERRGLPAWLKLEKEKFLGEVMDWPTREQLTMPIQEQLIVELYSK
ncbi:MAG: 30S ribosomal protein S4 [Deltaproteobacteria bacterium RIFCSPLOWO2_01_44_7]|nr:MAG: 30S ribosomal protein S4 [Deltaproteobacteria bacterium RIFCSPHIGHO2_01_FULL_43_49]OGQ14949.1 MAG: 30S ribosomal protein S4 [Deltaproteobacteria bacterium RIFCSPHIGHO2_02_FULL_44_53]OGQ29548.1 MAG: 30S ribosomal protein S4 [Deltaproteobacteria bacterium RIFCSPHIGHO2_12_FULL_44_21]OGQ31061.1 MAG: 30S ribosomal protein S4 [Deltaproteobacteria bacterium RIFCSPLOWO2_01_FULL_45_74]OGQ41197.1 MAG: 30S ribosomal protein S4 [Deltaproteobacteria bacterium RIFCSPLOWO2_01_44_7]OGQ42663.1 MAG: 30S